MATGGTIGSATFDIQVHLDDLWNGLKQAEQRTLATTKTIGSSLNNLASTSQSNFKNIGYGMMQLAYVADDVQYGFRAIVNNIPQLVMGLGGSAGLAGAVGIAAVAVNQLIQHWDYLSDAMQAAWSGSTLEQLQAIREKAEQAADAFGSLAKSSTEMEAAGARGIAKAITEGPTGKVLEGVLAGVMKDPAMRSPVTEADKKRLALAREVERKQPEAASAIRNEIRDRIMAENRQIAANILGGGSLPGDKGKSARDTLLRFAEANPGAFPPGFAGDVARMDPEEMKRQAALEREGELRAGNLHNEDLIRERERKRKEKEDKERKREADKENREWERSRAKAKHEREMIIYGQQAMINQQLSRNIRTPERGQASFSDAAQFHNQMQIALFDKRDDLLKKQLEVLNQIRQNTAQNVAGQGVMGAAGVAALAVGID